MKRVRCPKCDHFILFDETLYADGQSLVFQCDACGKQFSIRMGATRLRDTQKQENAASKQDSTATHPYGCIKVIENVFHFSQEIPLQMGDNTIGRYQKGSRINTPIETVDPSVDMTHCVINVSRDKQGRLRFTLRDAGSNTGTFVGDTLLTPRERRIIGDGTLFTIGATSVLLKV